MRFATVLAVVLAVVTIAPARAIRIRCEGVVVTRCKAVRSVCVTVAASALTSVVARVARA